MAISRKAVLSALAGAVLLSGCAAYDGGYGYGYGYNPNPYGYGDPSYYGYPAYTGPAVGLGFTYTDPGYRREWRGDHRDGDGYRDRNWDRDRDGRRDGWRNNGRQMDGQPNTGSATSAPTPPDPAYSGG